MAHHRHATDKLKSKKVNNMKKEKFEKQVKENAKYYPEIKTQTNSRVLRQTTRLFAQKLQDFGYSTVFNGKRVHLQPFKMTPPPKYSLLIVLMGMGYMIVRRIKLY